jgi:hypothetical protein
MKPTHFTVSKPGIIVTDSPDVPKYNIHLKDGRGRPERVLTEIFCKFFFCDLEMTSLKDSSGAASDDAALASHACIKVYVLIQHRINLSIIRGHNATNVKVCLFNRR